MKSPELLLVVAIMTLFAAFAHAGFDDGRAAYNKGDYVKAYQEFKASAEQGNALAQFNLGFMYDNGLSIPRDYSEAAKWYCKAAEQGHIDAQYHLGVMYAAGRGVKKDFAEAVKWYRKAAEHGHVDAQYHLGVMYATGRGVRQDFTEAAKWYRKAAEHGNVSAESQLEKMYASGQGVPQSDSEAQKWRDKVTEQNKAFVDFLSSASSAQVGCVSVGGYYLTTKQLREMNNNGTVDPFSMGNITDLITMYSDDVYERLYDSITDKPRAQSYLDCALKLSMSEETIVNLWYQNNITKVANKNSQKDFIEALYSSASNKMCEQYNQIAMYCERNNMQDTAQEVYLHVLSSYKNIDTCAKDAEISLKKITDSRLDTR
jgi:TPR repeat protein